jgi:hypothetical protein
MAEETSPLSHLLGEITKAATSGFPFLAVTMAVALPDICVSLASEDGRTDGIRYKAWCKANMESELKFATADDLWSMRCGVVHNGRFGDLKHNVARLLFVPANSRAQFTDCKMNDAYVWSVDTFCSLLTAATARWFEKNKSNPTVQSNLPRLMQWYPNGLKPYIDGIPVFA